MVLMGARSAVVVAVRAMVAGNAVMVVTAGLAHAVAAPALVSAAAAEARTPQAWRGSSTLRTRWSPGAALCQILSASGASPDSPSPFAARTPHALLRCTDSSPTTRQRAARPTSLPCTSLDRTYSDWRGRCCWCVGTGSRPTRRHRS